ncbi:MAG: phospholipase domain-containing protein [Puia sp.]
MEFKKLNRQCSIDSSQQGDVGLSVVITDNAYKSGQKSVKITSEHSENIILPIDLSKQHHWYDFTVSVGGNETFTRRYAGRVRNRRVRI